MRSPHNVVHSSISVNYCVSFSSSIASEGNNPMLCVVSVEGGPGTLKTVHDSLDAGTPVVLVAGSGRVTDVLAFAVRHTRPALPALTLGKIECVTLTFNYFSKSL